MPGSQHRKNPAVRKTMEWCMFWCPRRLRLLPPHKVSSKRNCAWANNAIDAQDCSLVLRPCVFRIMLEQNWQYWFYYMKNVHVVLSKFQILLLSCLQPLTSTKLFIYFCFNHYIICDEKTSYSLGTGFLKTIILSECHILTWVRCS